MESITEAATARRFIKELLKQTRVGKSVPLSLIGAYTSCSTELLEHLASQLKIPVQDGIITLTGDTRLNIAISEAKRGYLQNASRYLQWQDFERFAESCLNHLGFKARRDVRLKGEGRNWQIDVTGTKDSLLVCLDCKHWASPMSPSRFKSPAEHQFKATSFFSKKIAEETKARITSLPLIVTLFEPPQRSIGKTVIVDVQRLPSLLGELTPFTDDMPFIIASPDSGENPIRN